MKTFYFWIFIFAIFPLDVIAQTRELPSDEGSILICANSRRSGETNRWWLLKSRLLTLPKWRYQNEEIPLALKDAIAISKKWIIAKEGPGEFDIDTITIDSLHSDSKDYRYIYYYKIVYSVRAFDRGVCIVLMDGTVLEPDNPSEKN